MVSVRHTHTHTQPPLKLGGCSPKAARHKDYQRGCKRGQQRQVVMNELWLWCVCQRITGNLECAVWSPYYAKATRKQIPEDCPASLSKYLSHGRVPCKLPQRLM